GQRARAQQRNPENDRDAGARPAATARHRIATARGRHRGEPRPEPRHDPAASHRTTRSERQLRTTLPGNDPRAHGRQREPRCGDRRSVASDGAEAHAQAWRDLAVVLFVRFLWTHVLLRRALLLSLLGGLAYFVLVYEPPLQVVNVAAVGRELVGKDPKNP